MFMSIYGDRFPSSRDYIPVQPTIGRIVLFNTESGPHVALITLVSGNEVTLHVLPPNEGAYNVDGVLEGSERGTWRWPPRV